MIWAVETYYEDTDEWKPFREFDTQGDALDWILAQYDLIVEMFNEATEGDDISALDCYQLVYDTFRICTMKVTATLH